MNALQTDVSGVLLYLFINLLLFFLLLLLLFLSLSLFCTLGIPANVSADQLRSILESNFDIGKVSVTKDGTCASYKWTVEWTSNGGDQPALAVNGSGLIGNKISIKAYTIENGGLFLRPIPGDMLRVAEAKQQVKKIAIDFRVDAFKVKPCH